MKKVLDIIKQALAALAEVKSAGPRADSIKAHLESCASNAQAELDDAAKAGRAAPEPKAKAGYGLLKLLAAMAVVCVFCVFCGLTRIRAETFNTTNVLSNTNQVQMWPTNTPGQGTGTPISILNQDRVGFYFGAYVATNGNQYSSNVIVTILHGWGSSPPQSALRYGTNLLSNNTTNLAYMEWESPSNSTAMTLTIPIPVMTNYFAWFTNLEPPFVAGANWLGIYSLTPMGSNVFMTNVVMGLNKKIIPIRYP